ncbi:MAG TPA: class I SAM-dependent methyltransferase [Gaiellaceae bacterium]|nr:class I SAM-dependent methyltransferase [Gaiellaceae bacterium]
MAGWLVDPDAVADEYASEEALRERSAAYDELLEGPDEDEIVRARIHAARPRRLLDVGSGFGDLCAWAKADLDAEVAAVDSSPRMVELSAQAGATAILADMRALPFPDRSFDCVVACGVLYHVPDPERAIAEAARVLDADGMFLATTGSDDEHERLAAWESLFGEEIPPYPTLSFSRENGRNLLLRHFRDVEQVDCDAVLVFPTRERLVRYVSALPLARDAADRVPELTEPFRLPNKGTVFLASTPS